MFLFDSSVITTVLLILYFVSVENMIKKHYHCIVLILFSEINFFSVL